MRPTVPSELNFPVREEIMSDDALALGSFPAIAERDELFGTYKLVSTTRTTLDTGQVVSRNQTGYIIYDKSGRMIVLVLNGERPNPGCFDKMTDLHRIDLFDSMVAYAGTYRYDGKTIEHCVDLSWNEMWTGTIQIRDVRREGDILISTTRPAPDPFDGRLGFTTLIWERVR